MEKRRRRPGRYREKCRGLRLRGWLPMLSGRTDRGTYQSNYQLHRALGGWLFPGLILLAFRSFYQNMPQYVRPVVNEGRPGRARDGGPEEVAGAGRFVEAGGTMRPRVQD